MRRELFKFEGGEKGKRELAKRRERENSLHLARSLLILRALQRRHLFYVNF